MTKNAAGIIIIVLIAIGGWLFYIQSNTKTPPPLTAPHTPSPTSQLFPMDIQTMKAKQYPGSSITIEQRLSDGSNYHRYVVSYMSDGFKIYGLLTVPIGNKPANGWPVILVNHGYIPPTQYSTINSYAIAVDPLASAGYIVFKPDYRGNGNSEGNPAQVYISPDYVTDSLNALSSIKKYKDADSHKIGLWGHSMGGNITLHELVITDQFKAADIWAGVVGSYSDILDWWHHRIAAHSIAGNDLETAHLVQQFEQEHGTPQSNSDFWNSIDPTHFLSNVSVPVLIQVGTADEEVPPEFSENLYQKLNSMGKNVQLKTYPGANHNLAPDSTRAMQTSINFFNKYLK